MFDTLKEPAGSSVSAKMQLKASPRHHATHHSQAKDQREYQADEGHERERVVVVCFIWFEECNEAQEDHTDENGAQNLHRAAGRHKYD
jgi:hypothetical protein